MASPRGISILTTCLLVLALVIAVVPQLRRRAVAMYWGYRIHRAAGSVAEGQCQGALSVLEKAREPISAVDPSVVNSPRYQYLLGFCYVDAGQNEKAIEAFECALQLDPTHEDSIAMLGLAYYRAGESGKALPLLEKAAETDKDSACAWYNLALAHYDLKDYQKSAQHSHRAVALEPNHGPAYRNLAQAYARLHEFGKAADACRKAMEHDDDPWLREFLKVLEDEIEAPAGRGPTDGVGEAEPTKAQRPKAHAD